MTEENPKPKKSTKFLQVLSLVLVIVILISLSAFFFIVNRNLVTDRDLRTKQDLIRSQLPAQACGVLSPGIAEATIGENLKRNSRVVQTIAFEDGCTYTNQGNSNVYASLVIRTFVSQENAQEFFAEDRKLRIESENRDPQSYGDEMYYSAGSFFILDGNQTYSVSASKEGIDKDKQEAFSRVLMETVIPNINL